MKLNWKWILLAVAVLAVLTYLAAQKVAAEIKSGIRNAAGELIQSPLQAIEDVVYFSPITTVSRWLGAKIYNSW
jgi:hypothetical protein